MPAVEMRSKVAKEMAIKEKAQKEKALRELADQARRERAGGAAVPVAARDSGAPALAAINGGGNLRMEDELPPPPGMGQVGHTTGGVGRLTLPDVTASSCLSTLPVWCHIGLQLPQRMTEA